MLECGDLVIGQQLGEQVERKDDVEFFGARRIASSPIVTGQFPFATRTAFPFGTFLTVFTRMPKPQHVDRRLPDLISYFVMANENSPNLSRVEFLQPFADARLFEQACWSARQRLHSTSRSLPIYRCQEIIEAPEIGDCLTRPLKFHHSGKESGLPLSRLSAQAWTAW